MKLNENAFELNKDHERWAQRHANRSKYGNKPVKYWRGLIKKQQGKCALTCAQLLFNAESGMPIKGGRGCHPLYAAADHKKPQDARIFQIICYDINDLKGHLPPRLFNALQKTKEWKSFIKFWKQAADRNSPRSVFHKLIKSGGQ